MRTTSTVTRRFVGAAFTILFATIMAAPSLATTMTFQDGSSPTALYTGTEDTMLNSTDANNNYGKFTFFDVGASFLGDVRRSLIRFDVSALSNQYTQINSITLNLFPQAVTDVFGGNSNTNTFQVYQVAAANAAWIEGGGIGGPVAASGEPTWNNRAHPSTAWAGSAGLSTPTTDYVNTLLASVFWDTNTVVNSSSNPMVLSFTGSPAALTALIDSWVAPGGNGGLLLRGATESFGGYNEIRINSADAATASLHPELVINFTAAVPEPTTALLVLGGAVLIWRRRSR